MTHPNDDHDFGLHHDLGRLLKRRQALALLGAGLGMGFAQSASAQVLSCVADARETAGPYPADGTNTKAGQTLNVLTQSGVIRQDMRSSFNGLSGSAEGVRLDFEIALVNVAAACTPLSGYAIYAWHCDPLGQYSLYDLTDQNYLRGVQITDTAGKVRFTTIFPGCYDGRWPHIHFEVFASPDDIASGRDSQLISQIALPATACASVYANDARYPTSTRNLGRSSMSRDMVFRDDTAAQTAQRTMALTQNENAGYTGTVTVGVTV